MAQVTWRRSSFCANGACLEVGAGWHRSTACASGKCVECANDGNQVLVRDSKLGDASDILKFNLSAWRSFLADVREDAFTG